MRALAILAFAGAAVLVGVGRSSDNRLLVGLGAGLFLLGRLGLLPLAKLEARVVFA